MHFICRDGSGRARVTAGRAAVAAGGDCTLAGAITWPETNRKGTLRRPDRRPRGAGALRARNPAAEASLYEYFTRSSCRAPRPQEDPLSALLTAEVEGRQASEAELLGVCLLLLVAGHATTTNLVSNTVGVLAERPEERHRLADAPERLPAAVDAMLRFDSPVQGLSRTLTRDVQLHGTTLREGDSVLLLFGSANRDERVFADPDRFDPDRVVDRQLAFGRGSTTAWGGTGPARDACGYRRAPRRYPGLGAGSVVAAGAAIFGSVARLFLPAGPALTRTS